MADKTKRNWPPYVYDNHGSIIYRPRIPVSKQDVIPTKSGFLSPPIKLGKCTDSDAAILRAYLSAKETIDNTGIRKKNTLNNLSRKYLSSKRFARLKSATQEDYRFKLNRFLRFPIMINGSASCVGEMLVSNVKKPILRRLLDKMLEDYQSKGRSGYSIVNGQFRVFSAMLTYGIQYLDHIGLEFNPCIGIELHTENKRSRYVTDEEYAIQYRFAEQHGADYLSVVFEHAYLLASRSIEVTSLLVSNVVEEGYIVHRRKGSKTNLIRWSPRLKSAHQAAAALRDQRTTKAIFLIPNSNGRQLNHSTLQSAMARLKRKMTAAGLESIFWTLHDLKRKGISDSKNKKIGGHKTRQMEQRYDLEMEAFDPPGSDPTHPVHKL